MLYICRTCNKELVVGETYATAYEQCYTCYEKENHTLFCDLCHYAVDSTINGICKLCSAENEYTDKISRSLLRATPSSDEEVLSDLLVLKVRNKYYIGKLRYNEQTNVWLAYEKHSKRIYDTYSEAYTALYTNNYTKELITQLDHPEYVSLTPFIKYGD